ncbi:unnamed protein product, partial [Prorocentrum cordatum]
STPCSSSTDSKIDTLIGNMEMLSQLVANQTVDMNSIKEACKVSADRCAALTDQMTLISREYHSRHQELQASVTASLNALDYRMGVLENCGGDSHMSDAADPTLTSKVIAIEGSLSELLDRQRASEAHIAALQSPPTPPASPSPRRTTTNQQNAQDQTCKLVLLGFTRPMLASDLKLIGNSCVHTFAPAQSAAKIIVRGFDMSKKVSLHFETALDASSFLDNFNRTNGSWSVADPLHTGVQLSLRLRRDLDFQGRQLFLSLGRVRRHLTDLMRNRGFEVGSSGLGGCVYILRGPHDPVPAVNISVCDSGAVTTEIVRDTLIEFGIPQHAAALEEAAQVQLRRPFRR